MSYTIMCGGGDEGPIQDLSTSYLSLLNRVQKYIETLPEDEHKKKKEEMPEDRLVEYENR
jgi:hypothetical protein